MKNKPIFLIGYMATGKSTLGRALALDCGLEFIDLDDAVEHAAGRSIADIFAAEGEAAFRALEAEVLRQSARSSAIVACGGGTPCFGSNLDFMLEAGTVVCLQAQPSTIARRLLEAPEGQRPLVDSYRSDTAALMAHIGRMLAAREPYYRRAYATFDADRLECEAEIAAAVDNFKKLYINQ